MDSIALDRALIRIAHQVLEKNNSLDNLGIVAVRLS